MRDLPLHAPVPQSLPSISSDAVYTVYFIIVRPRIVAVRDKGSQNKAEVGFRSIMKLYILQQTP